MLGSKAPPLNDYRWQSQHSIFLAPQTAPTWSGNLPNSRSSWSPSTGRTDGKSRHDSARVFISFFFTLGSTRHHRSLSARGHPSPFSSRGGEGSAGRLGEWALLDTAGDILKGGDATEEPTPARVHTSSSAGDTDHSAMEEVAAYSCGGFSTGGFYTLDCLATAGRTSWRNLKNAQDQNALMVFWEEK